MKTIAGALLSFFLAAAGMTQSAVFRLEELNIRPDTLSGAHCVQLGLFLDYSGPAHDWYHLEISLDYSWSSGILAGNPILNLSNFSSPAEVGLTSPGTPMTNSNGVSSSCASPNIINSLTLNPGSAIDMMTGNGPGDFIVEQVVPAINTGTMDGTSLKLTPMFTTTDGGSYLVAILEFPLTAPASNGWINLTFRNNSSSDNFITDGSLLLNPSLENGYIALYQEEDCDTGNYVVFNDNVGGTSLSSLNGSSFITGWLDPVWGGIGADLDLDIQLSSGVTGYRITTDDGFDTGLVNAAGPSTQQLSISPTSRTTNYTTTFYNLDRNNVPTPGIPCLMAVTIGDPLCNLVWDNGSGVLPAIGENGILQLTLTNATAVGGIFGSLDVPDGATGLADPIDITAGSTLIGVSSGTVTLELINQNVPDGTWAGLYSITNLVAVTDGSGCEAGLGFQCPANNGATLDGPVTLGNPLSGTLAGDNVVDYLISYNGISKTLPGGATVFTTTAAAVAGDTDITITARGFGPDGNPCEDSLNLDLDFVDASCSMATQDPDTTLNPVFPQTVVTLGLETLGASSVTIGGLPMTAIKGNPGEDHAVSWQFLHTATADTILDVSVSNPEGQTVFCSWTIEVTCANPSIYSAVLNEPLFISGSPGCVYAVRVTEWPGGSIATSEISVGNDGLGESLFLVEADRFIETGQQGLALVNDSRWTVRSVLVGQLTGWPDSDTILDLIPLLAIVP